MAGPAQRSTPTRRHMPTAAALWGDGFVDDGLCDLWAVRDWSLCSADEFVLLFPRLIPPAGETPAVLRAHLESCVSARAWRMSRLADRGDPVPLRSRLPVPEHGAECHRDWFADDGALTCWLRHLGLLHTVPGRVQAERQVLAFLDLVLSEIQAGHTPAWDERGEILLAFGAGLHPGYLWPEAALSPVRGITAGWLGHLDRGRRALMPMAVAEYMRDAFAPGAPIDEALAEVSGGPANAALLRQAACRRLAGHDRPVRMPLRGASRGALPPGRLEPVRAAGAAA